MSTPTATWRADTLGVRLFLLMWAALVLSHAAAYFTVHALHVTGADAADRPPFIERDGPPLPTFPSLPPTPGFGPVPAFASRADPTAGLSMSRPDLRHSAADCRGRHCLSTTACASPSSRPRPGGVRAGSPGRSAGSSTHRPR